MTDRKLDAQLAERLFGLNVSWKDGNGNWVIHNPKDESHKPYVDSGGSTIPCHPFTADWNGAGRGIEKMREKGYDVYMEKKEVWWVSFVEIEYRERLSRDYHESFPIAVALAALRALGVEA